MTELLTPSEVFDSFWAVALQDAQMSEDEYALEDGRDPVQFDGEPAAEYGPIYRAAVESICAKAEPLLARLNLNEYPRGQGESTLSEKFGSDLYMTSHGHGCGFWDGDWHDIGDELTELAKAMPSGDLAEHINGGFFFM
jgi:hypothetical protein